APRTRRAGGVAQCAALGAENLALGHPATDLAGPDPAPALLAFVERDDGARAEHGPDRGGSRAAGTGGDGLVGAVEHAASTRGDGTVDPGYRAVRIADLAPFAGLGDHLNGQARRTVFPHDAVIEARPLARAHAAGLQCDPTGDFQ